MIRFKYNWKWLLFLFFLTYHLLNYQNSRKLDNANWYHHSRIGNPQHHFNRSKYLYNKVINKKVHDQREFQKKIDATIQLARLYQQGIPDSYNRNGTKIKGIPPNPQKAIKIYKHLYDKYKLPHAMLWIGDIYHYDLENVTKAENIYITLQNNTNNEVIINHINERLLQIRNTRTPMLHFGNSTSNSNFGLINTINPMNPLMHNFLHRNTNHTRIVNNNNNGHRGQRNNRNNNINDNDEELNINNLRLENPRVVINDPQNVHDSTLLQSIRNSVNRLQKSTNITMNTSDSLKQIRNYINKYFQNDKKKDAIKALDRIEATPDIGSFETSSCDALSLVWNRINNEYKDPKYKESLKGNVVNQLADCVEHGNVVCNTGRYSHILGILDGADRDVVLKPKWALSQEMMNKASVIRNKMEKGLSSKEKQIINKYEDEITQEEKLIQDKFDNDLKNNIEQELKQDYVYSGIMTESNFNTELSKWINDI